MKPSILVVMLDFLVCSLLLFVIGTGGKQTQFASSAPPAAGVNAAFAPAAIQAMQEDWNREYDHQSLLTELNAQTLSAEQLRGQLTQTSATLRSVAEEKVRVEQARNQTQQALSNVQTQLTRAEAERQRLAQEGDTAKAGLAKLQTEMTSLQGQQAKLQQEKTALAQRAEQLDKTVASQQATIGTLSEAVRESQARMESTLTGVARDQQQMGSTLKQLDDFARTLPATMQNGVETVHADQQELQNMIAALSEGIKGMQGGLSSDDRSRLMQNFAEVTRGQQGLQTSLDTLVKAGPNEQITQSLTTIQTGQETLRKQTAKLADEIETIKSKGPGPFKSVKLARLQLQVAVAKRNKPDAAELRFNATSYPPLVQVDGRSYLVTTAASLGLAWSGLAGQAAGEVTGLKATIGRHTETPWSVDLIVPACALQADPHVVAFQIGGNIPGLTTMELGGPDAIFANGQTKFHVFKSTAAGLSFEVEVSPNLGDARYLVIKRQMSGLAAWLFENPAYRPEPGDYVVTADGKLVGIMIARDKCFVLSNQNITACALHIPLDNRLGFFQAAQQYQHLRAP